jgi:RNA polymerase sigma factor (sigma-70 family)
MAAVQLSKAVDRLRSVLVQQDVAELADGDLLQRYVRQGDEAAFGALLRRHGPMVLGVCRRILGNVHDAEDVFQATFLVLVRKARTLRSPGAVGNWLHGVAYRTAREAKRAAARRRAREANVAARAPNAEDSWAELQPVLDQELDRLPEKYRAVLVLCELEGKTRKEAARHLGCPEGTVASRLATARTMLARRLARHGFALSAPALAALLAENASACLAPALAWSTITAASLLAAGQTAAGAISANVATLTEGALKVMLLAKLKTVLLALPVLCLVGIGGTLLTYHPAAGQQEPAEKSTAVSRQGGLPEKPDAARPKVEYSQPFVVPTASEILRALPKDQARFQNPRIRCELVAFRLQEQKFYPLVGPAQLATAHFKCTVTGAPGQEVVVYVDNDRLLECHTIDAERGKGLVEIADYAAHASRPPAAATQDDLKRLQGKWEGIPVIQGGKAVNGHLTSFTIQGEKISYDATRVERFKIDSTKKPKHFDLTVLANEKEEKTVQGIFEIKGDELRICLEVGGKGRPTAFERTEGSPNRLIVLKRLKGP